MISDKGTSSNIQSRIKKIQRDINLSLIYSIDRQPRTLQMENMPQHYKNYKKLISQLMQGCILTKAANYSNDRVSQYFHRELYHYNSACVAQKTWKTQDCSKHLEKTAQYMMKQLSMILEVEHIRVQLQYCAVLSQLGNHEDSFKIAEGIIRMQKRIYIQSLKICQIQIKRRQNQNTSINFNKIMLEKAKVMLLILSQIQTTKEIVEECEDKYNSLSEDMYFWKSLPQNNEKMMRKKLTSESQTILTTNRNILGIKEKSSEQDWLSSFNIGSVMMIKPKKSSDVPQSSISVVFSSKRVMQQMFYTSITYFTIATETRFKDIDKDVKGLKQNEKIIKLKDHPCIKKCKTFHLKAIQLVTRFIPSSTHYVNHLIMSFNKNYKSNMDSINQENSLIYSDVYQPPKTQEKFETIIEPKKEQKPFIDIILHEAESRARSISSNKQSPHLIKFPKLKTKKLIKINRANSMSSNKTNSYAQISSSISQYQNNHFDQKEIKTFTFQFTNEVKTKPSRKLRSKSKSKQKSKLVSKKKY